MYAAKGTQAYAQIGVESAVMSASQQQLVTMLFDGVLSALVRARLFMQDNNQQGKGVSLSKAINIIENGLRVSLDEESKDELTQNLIALYSYMVRRLGNDSNLLIVFYVQIMPDDLVMQLHRF